MKEQVEEWAECRKVEWAGVGWSGLGGRQRETRPEEEEEEEEEESKRRLHPSHPNKVADNREDKGRIEKVKEK
ncbi:hypothetical protein E2C01_083828 [Portunus trituberculatus]|uniref:Uncharacterized protein n=1 Tax=Portunus trituberculatus TaxID=210409 RepID=A0A5B7J922_PORTR|nr:hypothetical protein [Portunus trituberculatus]